MAQDLALGAIVERIHSAALEPRLWSDVMSDIARLCGAHTGIFYEVDRVRGQSGVLGAVNIDPSSARTYEEHYVSVDPWQQHAIRSQTGRINLTHEFISDSEFRRSEFYQDYLRQSGIFYAMGGTVVRDADHMAVFGVQRRQARGAFSRELADMVEPLMPHLRQAYLTQRTLRAVRGLCATLSETLHLVPNPVLVVDGGGRLHFANRAGETLLARNDGLSLQQGIVIATCRQQAKLLAECLAKAARGKLGEALPRHDIALARQNSSHPLLVRLTPLPREGKEGLRVAMFVEPGSVAPTRVQGLSVALKLTHAETRLLDGLVAGKSLAAVSEEHAVSINTLRVQLRRLFDKTGTHRQAELVRFALTAGHSEPQYGAGD